jgi:hypothetical protein
MADAMPWGTMALTLGCGSGIPWLCWWVGQPRWEGKGKDGKGGWSKGGIQGWQGKGRTQERERLESTHPAKNTHRGARTHDHKVKGLTLYRLS